MAFNYNKAREAGYSDEEIMNHLAETHNFNLKKAKEAGYEPSEIIEHLSSYQPKQPEQTEDLGRMAAQLPQAALEMSPYGIATNIWSAAGTGEALSELEELEERLPELKKKFPQLDWPEKIDREKYLEATKAATGLIPTVSNIAGAIEEKTGLPLSPKTSTDKLIRFIGELSKFGTGSVQEKLMTGLRGAAVKSALEASGVPEHASDLLAFYEALRTKTPKINVTQEREALKGIPKGGGEPPSSGGFPPGEPPPDEIKKYPSGITMPKAAEGEFVSKARITPELQEKALKSIDEEAAKIARETLEKRMPKIKQIEEGYDFKSAFDEGFSNLKKAAEKANPQIDITDVTDFLEESRKKFAGLPKDLLPAEQRKILKEIKALANRPQTSLNKLLDLFRLNNKKRSLIYETRFLKGKQKDYTDFLTGLNNAIESAFEKTLPEDSIWLNTFKRLNFDYSDYLKSLQTLKSLESILSANAKPSTISKFAENPMAQKKLKLFMGEEASNEIIQLAKDMKSAREAIQNIPSKKIAEMQKIYPLGFLIPGLKIPAIGGAIKYGVDAVRRLYGWYLTTPARTKAVDEAVKAASKGDIEAYRIATDELKKENPIFK